MALTKNRFPQIIRELSPTARASKLEAALKAGAELIEQQAKQNVPQASGDLHDAIHVEPDGPFRYRVVAGNEKVFYGHLVEHGTVKTGARPFLVPAKESQEAAVRGLAKAALKRL